MQRRGGGGGLGRGCGRSTGARRREEPRPPRRGLLSGSVAEGRSLLSSDIDVLVVTRLSPGVVLARLWEGGYKDPFEVHVVEPERVDLYQKRSRLTH